MTIQMQTIKPDAITVPKLKKIMNPFTVRELTVKAYMVNISI
jgi:hypothetical protein